LDITNVLSLLLFIATAILALLGFLQWLTMKENIRQTQELVKFSKMQADASEKAAAAAYESAAAANRSTILAEQSTVIAREEFSSERKVIWNAVLNNDGSELILKPFNDNVKLFEGLVYYIEIYDEMYGFIEKNKDGKVIPVLSDSPVIPPEYSIYLKPILYTCGERIFEYESRVHGEVMGGVRVTYFPIPIIISSLYLAKGSSYKDVSLYRLLVRDHLRPYSKEKYSFEYLGLEFVKRLSGKEDMKSVLEYEWKNALEYNSYLSGFPKESAIRPKWKRK
jgi:hypothetical protein